MSVIQNSSEDFLSDPKLELHLEQMNNCYLETYNFSQELTIDGVVSENVSWCPRTFDGYLCWAAAPPSSTALQLCPEFVIGFDARQYAFKRCMDDGTWFLHPESNRTWTNYTTCVDMEDLRFRSMVNDIYVYGYILSAVALVFALAIFLAFYKKLKCPRVRVHMQLFTSLLLHNICWVVWYRTVVNDVTVVLDNKEWCQVLHLLTYYFMVTSYLWMFCEGLHLHVALVIVFVVEEVAMRWFLTIGWGVSLLIIIAYGLARIYTPGDTERCWIDDSNAFWIIITPVAISLFASIVFLVNVVRMVWIKLRTNQDQNTALKKTIRATLILIPLFGLHFVLIPLHPEPGTIGEKIHQIFSALLTSLQGLCVAVLYCFTNKDVILTIKERVAKYRNTNEDIPMTVHRQVGMTS